MKCMQENHAPADCEQVEKWQEMQKTDSQFLQWAKVNSRPCPKCKAFIEKNGGCMHVRCRNCTHEFCWICKSTWFHHTETVCPGCQKNLNEEERKMAFAGKVPQSKDHDKDKDKLEGYLKIYDRHTIHAKSEETCKKSMDKIKATMAELNEEMNYPYNEIKFLQEVTDIVIKCRHSLKWAFVAELLG